MEEQAYVPIKHTHGFDTSGTFPFMWRMSYEIMFWCEKCQHHVRMCAPLVGGGATGQRNVESFCCDAVYEAYVDETGHIIVRRLSEEEVKARETPS